MLEGDDSTTISWLTGLESVIAAGTTKTYTVRGVPQGFKLAAPTETTPDIVSFSLIGDTAHNSTKVYVNGTSTATAATNDALVYRYSCRTNASATNPSTYEVSANLESNEYKNSGTNDKESKDGGNNNNLYEAGTDLTILPNTDTY